MHHPPVKDCKAAFPTARAAGPCSRVVWAGVEAGGRIARLSDLAARVVLRGPSPGTRERSFAPMNLKTLALLAIVPLAALSLSGCGKDAGKPAVSENGLAKIKVGYIGLTCEAPLFMAQENGFFKEEGLEVEMVKCEWSKYKDVLALGGFDITHHLIMMFLKPLEQGLNVKFTGGVHTGCLRVQTSTESTLKTAQDLKGKRIGVPG